MWILSFLHIYRGAVTGLGRGGASFAGGVGELVMRVGISLLFAGTFGYAAVAITGPAAWVVSRPPADTVQTAGVDDDEEFRTAVGLLVNAAPTVAVNGAQASAYGPYVLTAKPIVAYDGKPLTPGGNAIDWLIDFQAIMASGTLMSRLR